MLIFDLTFQLIKLLKDKLAAGNAACFVTFDILHCIISVHVLYDITRYSKIPIENESFYSKLSDILSQNLKL